MSAPRVTPNRELRQHRRRGRSRCYNHLLAAPLWPKHGVNLGTLLRTCDAVGACLVVPRLPWVPEAIRRGNTLPRPACVHWVGSSWLAREHAAGTYVVAVELTDESIRLAELPMARRRTVLLLGHESTGIPAEAMDLVDLAVQIPMIGSGVSLNVAVAGSLCLYRLAGMS